jgi:polar amino acid transport system substrate-binding protein
MRLGHKFIVTTFLFIILPTLILNELFFRTVSREMQEDRFAALTSIADLKVAQIEGLLKERHQDIQEAQVYENIINHLPLLQRHINDRDNPVSVAAVKSLDRQLKPLQKLKDFYDIMLVTADGVVAYSSNDDHKNHETGLPFVDPLGGILQQSRQTIFLSDIFQGAHSGHGYEMYIAGPVHDQTGNFLGFVLISMDMTPVYTLIQDSTGLGRSGETLIGKRRENQVLFLNPLRHDPEAALQRTALVGSQVALPLQRAVQGKNGHGIAIDYRNEEVIAVWRHIPEHNWGLVAKIDSSEAFAPITRLRWISYLCLLLIICLGTGMMLVISRSVTNPLTALQNGARRLGRGELDFRFADDQMGGRELRQLALDFNTMADRLAESYATLEYKVRKRTVDLELSRRVAISVMEDVEQQRLQTAEALLRLEASHLQLQTLSQAIEQSPVTVMITDRKGIISYVNPVFTKISGYSPEEVLGQHARILSSGQQSTDHYRQIWQIIQAGEVWHGEFSNKKKNGELYWERSTIAPIFNKNKEIINFVSVKEDISSQRKTRQALASMARFAEENPGPAFRIDSQGIILLANEASRTLFGDDNLVGKTLPDGQKALGRANIQAIIAGDINIQQECEIQGRNILFSLHGNSKHGNANVYGTDITDLKKTEADLQQRVEELAVMRLTMLNIMEDLKLSTRIAEESTRAKGEFLANMSHEIRTPMNAILGMTYLAQQTALTPKQQDYLGKIAAAGNSLLAIINDILDFSKIEAGRLEMESVPFELDDVLSQVTDLVSQQADKKGLELLLSRPANMPSTLKGDPLRLGQVLINLANNAVKFSEKGEIIITVGVEHEEESSATLRFSVKDCGIGMSSGQVAGLFQAFSQADTSTTRRYGGTGLGLSISKQLVEMMGGEISVESSPGQGSTFSFTAGFELSARSKELNRTIPADLRGLRALIVDDSPNARQILQEMLTSFGCNVDVAASGEEAMEMLVQACTAARPYSLVLMDWLMPPGIDGLETASRIKTSKNINTMPVIIMVTAFDREKIQRQAKRQGLDGFLAKPVTPSDMLTTLRSIFNPDEYQKKILGHPQISNKEQSQQFKGARILLAEDNEINQQVATELLEKTGLLVDVVNNGEEALRAVQEKSYDLVLMDIQMPVMDGYSATKAIRELDCLAEVMTGEEEKAVGHTPATLPILAMTAHAMAGDREKCLNAGMNDHISKPIDPQKLYAAIDKWINKWTTSDPRKKSEAPMVASEPEQQAHGKFPPLPPTLPGIDLSNGLARVGGNEKFYRNLLHKFQNGHAGAADELRQALAKDDDNEQARFLVHTLKGVAGTLGGHGLQKAAAALEFAIKDKKTESIAPLLFSLEGELKQFIDSISSLVEFQSENKEEEAAVDLAAFLPTLTELATLLSESDTRAASLLEMIQDHIRGTSLQEPFSAIDSLVRKYDFEEALAALTELMGKIVAAKGSQPV